MNGHAITVGEVEHGGDLRFTTEQIEGVEGVESARAAAWDFERGVARYRIGHGFETAEDLTRALARAGVCI